MPRHLPALALAAALAGLPSAARAAVPCEKLWTWLEYQCNGAGKAWYDGTPDLYLTGYAYHSRNTYSEEWFDENNENAWGGGFGWSEINPRGDNFGWYGLMFRDSHFKFTKMFGMVWMTYWSLAPKSSVGLGYTAFIASRPDTFNNFPFPGILPLASLRLNKLELMATYIPKIEPNTTGNGNVAFFFARWHF